MKRITLLLAALMALLLTGCCMHKWTPATCETAEICTECGESRDEALGHDYAPAACAAPETCSRCGAVRGEALGHDWAAATCETPEKCTRCAATQGEVLHQYGRWAAIEGVEKMSRSCSACGAEESREMDWTEYFNSVIIGRWVSEYFYTEFFDLQSGAATVRLGHYPDSFEFHEDGTVSIHNSNLHVDIVEGSWQLEVVNAWPEDGSSEPFTACVVYVTLEPEQVDGVNIKPGTTEMWFCANDKEFFSDLYYFHRGTPLENSGFNWTPTDPEFIRISKSIEEMGALDRLYCVYELPDPYGYVEEVYARIDPDEPVLKYAGMLPGTWVSREGTGLQLEFDEYGSFTGNDSSMPESLYYSWDFYNAKWRPTLLEGQYEITYILHPYHEDAPYLGSSIARIEYDEGVDSSESCRLEFYAFDSSLPTDVLVPAGQVPSNYLEQFLDDEKKERIVNAIVGSWQVDPETAEEFDLDMDEIPGEELSFSFNPDGSFSFSSELPLSGTWEFISWSYDSKDESFLSYDLTGDNGERLFVSIYESRGRVFFRIGVPSEDGSYLTWYAKRIS